MSEQDNKLIYDITETFIGFLNDRDLTAKVAVTICVALLHQIIASASNAWGDPHELTKRIYKYIEEYHEKEDNNDNT